MSWHLIGFINSSLFKWTMNKTLTLGAIAMFAVIMGMSAVAPAMAAPTLVEICHMPDKGEGERDPVTIEVNEKSVPAHLAHGDKLGPCT